MPERAASQTEYARYAWCGPAASRTWTFRSYQAVGVSVIIKVSANPWVTTGRAFIGRSEADNGTRMARHGEGARLREQWPTQSAVSVPVDAS